jgi:hypothetical protein
MRTMVRGRIVFLGGEVVSEPVGRLIRQSTK